ncbi:MAG: LPXTG cell wall anchor domain-containing protein [Oscillospiraceae bacterium]|nr:LPXTG cell wall anchor domain-containing protein [Oscillospiraceae bacterium]
MKKRVLISAFVAIAFGMIQPFSAMATDIDSTDNIDEDIMTEITLQDTVKITNSGQISLISNHAELDNINTMQLSLQLDSDIAIANAYFNFEEINAKVATYRYKADSNQINIYLSGKENLFTDSDLLELGTVIAEDEDGYAIPVTISVVEDSLKYVYQNQTQVYAFTTETEPAPETTTVETTTTVKPETTTTAKTETTTTAKTETTTTAKPETTTTAKTETTTTAKTETTTTAKTETTTTAKPETTTTAKTETTTTAKPETTTTAKPETTTTVKLETTTTAKPETTTTQATTIATTVAPTEPATTTTSHVASDEEFCDWAINDYQDKTGVTPANAELTEIETGQYEITLTDDAGAVLDTYVIDPVTGVGTNSNNEEINLPQTGNNSMKNLQIAIGAFVFAGIGFCLIETSGVIRRKKNEQ